LPHCPSDVLDGHVEVGDAAGSADGADDGVAAVEQLGGQLAAEATADAGDEPVP
jgi:hypothetical protein